ncbi:lytic murein transglycosylase [Rhodopila sp.]|uniref:lytic murein transglycosylase n=1 Tax=Rhodopila sp. TaxID=2480087 RepID=UPI003D0D75F2
MSTRPPPPTGGLPIRHLPTRRLLLASAVPAVLSVPAWAIPSDSFRGFLNSVRIDAGRAGIRPTTLDSAFAGVEPNQKVLDRDQHQPEFTMTWARYRSLVITEKRILAGRQAVIANRALFQRVEQRYGVNAAPIAGIWGLESSFGTGTGDFRVVEALATLGWEGRRASFFRGELMAALKILDHGDVAPTGMTGSYAGAMGQPQFMPSSYLRYAVDFEGNGRRDIWTSRPDVLGSIANYLAQSGWRPGQTWGQAVSLPPGLDAAGREAKRPLSEWVQAGVRPAGGRWEATSETPTGLVAPDGSGGEVFAVFGNFAAIRRYNPSDFYAIAVGLIGDRVLT